MKGGETMRKSVLFVFAFCSFLLISMYMSDASEGPNIGSEHEEYVDESIKEYRLDDQAGVTAFNEKKVEITHVNECNEDSKKYGKYLVDLTLLSDVFCHVNDAIERVDSLLTDGRETFQINLSFIFLRVTGGIDWCDESINRGIEELKNYTLRLREKEENLIAEIEEKIYTIQLTNTGTTQEHKNYESTKDMSLNKLTMSLFAMSEFMKYVVMKESLF